MASYQSYKKFQEISEEKIKFLREKNLEKSPIIFNFQHFVGYQAKMANFLSRCTKINLTAQELWEVEVLISIFYSKRFDVNFISSAIGLNEEMRADINKYKEQLGEQYFNYEGRNSWELVSKKEKEKKCSESDIVEGLSSKRYIKKEGGTTFWSDVWSGAKTKVKYPKEEHIIIKKSGNILDMKPEILNAVNDESCKIQFVNGYISTEQIVNLFEKHKAVLGKLHRSGKIRISITDSDIYCNLNNFCTINGNGGAVNRVYDWEALDGWKEKIIEKDVRDDILSVRYKDRYLGNTLRSADLSLIYLLSKEEDFEDITNEALIAKDNNIHNVFNRVVALNDLKKSKLENLTLDKSDNPSRNLLLYEMINQKEEDIVDSDRKFLKILENLLYVALKRSPDILMDISVKNEGDEESELNKVLEIIESFENSDKKRFLQDEFKKINNTNIKIDTNTDIDEMVSFRYTKSAIFNLGIDMKKLSNNASSIEKETTDIFQQIVIVNYPEKTLVNFFLDESLGKSSELTGDFIETLKNLFNHKDGYLRENEIKEIVNNLKNAVRENNLQKSFKDVEKNNVHKMQKRKI